MRLMNKSNNNLKDFNQIIMLSAWSFIIVISSFMFLMLGRWIDERFNTEPAFMIGLLVLAIGLCLGRFYVEITKASGEMRNIRHRRI